MKTTKQLGIWMDHSRAHLMEVTDPGKTITIVSDSTHEEKEKSLQKGESLMQNKEQQQQAEFYKKIGESIINYDEVLLFGPTNAKLELHNILKEDRHFSGINIETMQAEKMTENQQHAFVKAYFSGN